MKAPIRFGVIGLGNWGKQHIRQLKGLPPVELRWFCDVDAVLAEGTAHWNGIPYWTAEWSDMMAAL
jgi:predicted dehydrogenase